MHWSSLSRVGKKPGRIESNVHSRTMLTRGHVQFPKCMAREIKCLQITTRSGCTFRMLATNIVIQHHHYCYMISKGFDTTGTHILNESFLDIFTEPLTTRQ